MCALQIGNYQEKEKSSGVTNAVVGKFNYLCQSLAMPGEYNSTYYLSQFLQILIHNLCVVSSLGCFYSRLLVTLWCSFLDHKQL